ASAERRRRAQNVTPSRPGSLVSLTTSEGVGPCSTTRSASSAVRTELTWKPARTRPNWSRPRVDAWGSTTRTRRGAVGTPRARGWIGATDLSCETAIRAGPPPRGLQRVAPLSPSAGVYAPASSPGKRATDVPATRAAAAQSASGGQGARAWTDGEDGRGLSSGHPGGRSSAHLTKRLGEFLRPE